mmetsp:Transcript_7605/g.15298  ORF Transcript_7605/g.15298 Transcript_7605/m.15298 type:complete len:254 (+) Transcript_7605:573-1334(+)
MHSISAKDNVTVSPAPEELWAPVVQVPLFDALLGGIVEDVVDLVRPTLVKGLDVLDEVLLRIGLRVSLAPSPTAGCLLAPRRQSEECVPLDSPVPNIARDKVPLGSYVNLVSRLVIVLRLECRLPREDGVAGVGATLLHLAVLGGTFDSLPVHLGANRGPNTVGTHENVGMGGRTVGELHIHALPLAQALVPHYGVPVLYEVGLDLLALLYEDLLEVGSVDYPSEGQAVEVGTLLEWELYEPICGGRRVPKVA